MSVTGVKLKLNCAEVKSLAKQKYLSLNHSCQTQSLRAKADCQKVKSSSSDELVKCKYYTQDINSFPTTDTLLRQLLPNASPPLTRISSNTCFHCYIVVDAVAYQLNYFP